MELKITDLYNPQNIVAIATKQSGFERQADQNFQEWPGSIELWQQMKDGRLTRVQRWLKKSITHADYNTGSWEELRPYIKPSLKNF